jgi:hypothetical protein
MGFSTRSATRGCRSGASAILSNLLLAVLIRSGQRRFYFASLSMLILIVIGCSLVKAH